MDIFHSKRVVFDALVSHFQWRGQTLAHYGIRILRISNVFTLQALGVIVPGEFLLICK
jgi:hypothetical protein